MLRISYAVLTATLAVAPLAADETICRGSLSGSHDNVEVPAGATCVIRNADIEGSIKVFGGLRVLSGSRGTNIDGNIQAEPGNTGVEVGSGVRVGGDIQVFGAFGPTRVIGAVVDGAVQVKDGYARFVLLNTTVGGDVQMEQFAVRRAANSGEIRANTIDGNLQCQANRPPPIGSDNIVGGSKEDQCANF